MSERKRKEQASSTVPKPSSRVLLSAAAPPPPARVTLPSDLSAPLKYLDDAQLQRLLEAVTVEIKHRNQRVSRDEILVAPAAGTSPLFRNMLAHFLGLPWECIVAGYSLPDDREGIDPRKAEPTPISLTRRTSIF